MQIRLSVLLMQICKCGGVAAALFTGWAVGRRFSRAKAGENGWEREKNREQRTASKDRGKGIVRPNNRVFSSASCFFLPLPPRASRGRVILMLRKCSRVSTRIPLRLKDRALASYRIFERNVDHENTKIHHDPPRDDVRN